MISKQGLQIKSILESNGFKGLKVFTFIPISENEFNVFSESNHKYTITKIGNKIHCNCPQHMFRHKGCKHVDMFKNYLNFKNKEK